MSETRHIYVGYDPQTRLIISEKGVELIQRRVSYFTTWDNIAEIENSKYGGTGPGSGGRAGMRLISEIELEVTEQINFLQKLFLPPHNIDFISLDGIINLPQTGVFNPSI